MTTPKQLETTQGTVARINSKGNGIQLVGSSEYLNVSQYHPIAPMPTPGDLVEVTLERSDRGAWINSLKIIGASSAAAPGRDRTITRLAVLKAASNFLGLMSQCREEVRSEHVLVLADKWLQWVEDQPNV